MGPVIEAFVVGLAPVGLNSLTLTNAHPAFDNFFTMVIGALLSTLQITCLKISACGYFSYRYHVSLR